MELLILALLVASCNAVVLQSKADVEGFVCPEYQIDEPCSKDKANVCGTDGKTYDNSCYMCKAGTQLAHIGKCKCKWCGGVFVYECIAPPPSVCPYVLEPVCGEGDITYDNFCELCKESGQYVHEGRCDVPTYECPDPAPKACPKNWRPVCGKNGVTYGNLCAMCASGVELAHYGTCYPVPLPYLRTRLPPKDFSGGVMNQKLQQKNKGGKFRKLRSGDDETPY